MFSFPTGSGPPRQYISGVRAAFRDEYFPQEFGSFMAGLLVEAIGSPKPDVVAMTDPLIIGMVPTNRDKFELSHAYRC